MGRGRDAAGRRRCGQPTGTVAFLQQNLLVYTTGLAVMCTLLGAARIVYHEHKAAQLRDLGRYLATYVLVSAAAAGGASVLIGGCDQLASWLIGRASAGSGFADHLGNLLGLASASTGHVRGRRRVSRRAGRNGATAIIAIVLGIIAFLATVTQIMLMLVRGGMLVLLVGTLPLVAAFSNTEMGMQWFRKASAWLIAFALYKPAAAVVYAVAFNLAGQQGALALLDGVMMLVLAIPRCRHCCGSWCRRRARWRAEAAREGCSPERRAERSGWECRPARRRSLSAGQQLRPIPEHRRLLGAGAERRRQPGRADGHQRQRSAGLRRS